MSEERSVNPATELQPTPWRLANPRITVNEKVYFQPMDDKAVMVETVFSIDVQTEEQLYQRGPLKLKAGWQPLYEGCWIPPQDIGLIVISNLEGKNLQKIPTKAEIVEMTNRVIEIYIRNSQELKTGGDFPEIDDKSTFIEIPPRESQRFRVTDVRNVFIRPRVPGIKAKLFISPK